MQRLDAGEPMVLNADANKIEAVLPIDRPSGVYLYTARSSDLLAFSQGQRAENIVKAYEVLTSRARVLQLRFNGIANMIDTMTGLVAPYLVMSFGIFFMRQSIIQQVPDELIEAARVDGASEFRIFYQIVVPVLGSSLAALGIFAFLEAWNAYVWPLLVANSDKLFTMELGLSAFQSAFTLNIPLITAGSLISILPILIVYIILRRQILDSFSSTGLKS